MAILKPQRERASSWNLLKVIKEATSIPWMCMGDFNEITCQSEKVGVTLPLFLILSRSDVRSNRKQHVFRYETSWALRTECQSIIKEAWMMVAIWDSMDEIIKTN